MKRLFPILFLILATSTVFPQSGSSTTGWLPERGDHFVYDYCGLLSSEQVAELETALAGFSDSTSNQVVVMLTHGFGGRDISSFAFEVGTSWGVGQKDFNNGVVIVIKPKDDTDGEVEIATGKGLEGVLPDIFCKRIIEDEMIPRFKEDDYFGAIENALDIILPVCAGEYSFEQYKEEHDDDVSGIVTGLVIGGLCLLAIRRYKKWGGGSGGHSGGSFGGGYYGGHSFGGGSFSGGSSRPTFGGGSFGGGGASGRW